MEIELVHPKLSDRYLGGLMTTQDLGDPVSVWKEVLVRTSVMGGFHFSIKSLGMIWYWLVARQGMRKEHAKLHILLLIFERNGELGGAGPLGDVIRAQATCGEVWGRASAVQLANHM